MKVFQITFDDMGQLTELIFNIKFLCQFQKCIPPAPMNHVKYLRAGPAEMPFQNWYTADTNHCPLTDSVTLIRKTQLC